MGKVYYNAPISLFSRYLRNGKLPIKVFSYALAIEYLRQKKQNTNTTEARGKAYYVLIPHWVNDHMLIHATPINNDDLLEEGLKLFRDQEERTPKEPLFSIDSELFWRIYLGIDKKNKEQRLLLLAYMALKSICGKDKVYCKTNADHWLARISCKPNKDGKPQKEVIDMLGSKHKRSKIQSLLYEYYKMAFYSNHDRGFYFSSSLSLKELIIRVEKERGSKKQTLLKYDTQKILKGLGLTFCPFILPLSLPLSLPFILPLS